MRMLGLVTILVLIQIGCGLFYQNLATTNYTLNPYGEATSSYSLWNFIMAPILWNDSSFWVFVTTLIITGSAIFAGVLLGAKSDLTYLFPGFIFFAAFGSIPIASLYSVITSDVALFGCTVGSPCLPATLLAFVFSGVLAEAWIFTCIEWWSGRPAT